MFDLDWQGIFSPSVPVLEIIIRGSVVYLVLFALLRLTFKRIGGSIGLGDVLMIALVAAAAQNAIAREHHSVTDGLILIATIAFWSYVLDWLAHHWPAFEKFYHQPPLLLVKNGRFIHRNMRVELITEVELMAQLRRSGFDDVTNIAEAYIEADGTITAVAIESS
jgi:uncharacterized membrane protein YcaP (DUF421 family)